MKKDFSFSYEVISDHELLAESDKELFLTAQKKLVKSYSPYSQFKVSSIARMQNGTMIGGTNQENASYPVGICAERAMLSAIASLADAKDIIQSIAITFKNENGKSNFPISPCGMCRQALLEKENAQRKDIQLILGGSEGGEILILPSVKVLLPFGFSF